VGGGVKLPTGAFQQSEEGALINPTLQLATGSSGFPLYLIYTLRYKRAGINTANKHGYRFGSCSNAIARFFYWQQVKKPGLLPHAGLTVE
jgi:hypothetical protein